MEFVNAVIAASSALLSAVGVALAMKKTFASEVDKKIQAVERLTRLEGRVDKIENRVQLLDERLEKEISEIKNGINEVKNYLLNKRDSK